MDQRTPPTVLIIAGHDPSGGAGVHADIEAVRSFGCHAASAITTLTVQDTGSFTRQHAVPVDVVRAQVQAIVEDLAPAACKVGLVPTPECARALGELLRDLPSVPVVIDPVLATGSGADLATRALCAGILESLVPASTVLTPNVPEAQRLTGEEDVDAAARRLCDAGAEQVLVTGTHEGGDAVVNRLYRRGDLLARDEWRRLPGVFHGSGCTLAAAIAALLAHGRDALVACREAQAYTWRTLEHAYAPGAGQHVPDRLYRLREAAR